MPLPPPDPTAAGHPAHRPARVIMDSPLAASIRAGVYRRRYRERPRERGLRILAMTGALLVHLLFLFGFVLGPAYEVKPPPAVKQQALQVRLIELPPPPPPPPLRGTPPKQRGPRHQGNASAAMPVRERSANVEASTPVAATATPTPVAPVAPAPKPVAAPKPPASLPKPAPTPRLQPIPLAGEPPTVSLPVPTLQPPVPPKFQPEPVRKPQLEGTEAMPPPPSLALPELPAQLPTPISPPSMALDATLPRSSAPASVTPARVEQPAAPPVPELQAIPLPAQPAPTVNLQVPLSAPAPTVPRELPRVQAAAVQVVEAQSLPPAPTAAPQVRLSTPTVKIDLAEKHAVAAVQPSIARPQLSPAPTVASPAPQPASASQPSDTPASAVTAEPAQAAAAQPESGRDVSTAPQVSPQGSDNAVPGQPDGALAPPQVSSGQAAGSAAAPAPGQGTSKEAQPQPPGAGQPGTPQPGAAQGERQGTLGSYVQLKPSGDVEVMRHSAPNIGYRPTRFEGDWTPEGESSVDTALRHAVEKTTVAHTFHLPRGVRVECAVRPLLPIALFGCRNPDPPPAPVAASVYDRLHLAPSRPLVPAVAASSTVPPAPLKLDNSAQCAAARVAGGPPPPGCESVTLPVKLAPPPASATSTSWVPPSDQFH